MIETGKAVGMQCMDAAVAALVTDGRITAPAALAKAHNAEKLSRLIG
jgi:Tfp pilus assembly pilus retraction ATPase PilT